jgi:hypothetical protein
MKKVERKREMKVQRNLKKKTEWALEAIIVTYLSFIWIVSPASGLKESNVPPSSTSFIPEVSLSHEEEDSLSSKIPSLDSYSSSSIVASSNSRRVTSPPSDLIPSDNESPLPPPASLSNPETSSETSSQKSLHRSFRGYSVLRLTPTSKNQLDFLRQLQSNDSKVSDVFVSPLF